MPWSQDELDAIINQRLAWASRCASAIAHDLGNLVLIGEVATPGHAANDNGGRVNGSTSLVQHFRDLLRTLETWRHIDRDPGQLIPLTAWWQEQGGLLRQFVRRGIPVTMSKDPPAWLVDATLMTRVTGALLCAIDLQCPDLERLVLRASESRSDLRIGIDFVPTPKSTPNGLCTPSVVASLATGSRPRLALQVDEDDALFLLRVDAARPNGQSG